MINLIWLGLYILIFFILIPIVFLNWGNKIKNKRINILTDLNNMTEKERKDKIWKELSKESQKYLQEKYKIHDDEGEGYDLALCDLLDDVFGLDNICPQKFIKTWEDIEKLYEKDCIKFNPKDTSIYISPDFTQVPNTFLLENNVIRKLQATAKISKIIELGYGGAITDDEWTEQDVPKYCIIPSLETKSRLKVERQLLYMQKQFIAFHTRKQAEEFISYESNVLLSKQYYMM